jgi:glycine/D-amino acid oxidase-like deaminating enzyme
VTVDVAIIGAGFTGLWTAYYLAKARPDVRIAILEKEVAGLGASGRNGGWASALFPSSLETLAKAAGTEGALAQHAAMRATVDELIAVTTAEGIKADVFKGGTVVLARTPTQLRRAEAEVADARSWGRGEDDIVLLEACQARGRVNGAGTLGATYTPACAAVHPAKLARGLARVVSDMGVAIYEGTTVTGFAPHSMTTDRGTVTAEYVVRATEGFSAALPGAQRAVIPVYSLIIATEPLPCSVWDEIGLADRETFSDGRHLIVYGQRTADDRIVFGGRGAPYHFGSAIKPEFDHEPRVFEALRKTLVEMFPALRDARVTHQWGGPLGIARDWHASVGLDATTGIGWAGGYVGDGVTTTNLAGRTLRDLILGERTELTALPWVGHRSRQWEPEPLRWMAVNAGLRAMTIADAEERVTRRSSLAARLMSPFMGGH